MRVVAWDLPVKAAWSRSINLSDLEFGSDGLRLAITGEDEARSWMLSFKEVQAFRVTSEECAGRTLELLPSPGGLFEVLDSPWLVELGRGEVDFLDKSRHFVLCCYDEVVEVVAWDCEVVQAT